MAVPSSGSSSTDDGIEHLILKRQRHPAYGNAQQGNPWPQRDGSMQVKRDPCLYLSERGLYARQ